MAMISEPVFERISQFDDQTVLFLRKSFPDVKWEAEHLKVFLESSNNIVLVAKMGDSGAGLIRAHILPRYDEKKQEILLHEIDVVPQYQRQGIATGLINKLKDIAKEMSASEIWVITNRSNAVAVKLYEKAGFHSPQSDDVVFIFNR